MLPCEVIPKFNCKYLTKYNSCGKLKYEHIPSRKCNMNYDYCCAVCHLFIRDCLNSTVYGCGYVKIDYHNVVK